MPGVIMESERRNGAHTNHDRDRMATDTNGVLTVSDVAAEKGKLRKDVQQSSAGGLANGVTGVALATGAYASPVDMIPKDIADQIHQLPPEIVHITEGFESLPRLLTRLAQVTHNQLTKKILDLAAMHTPATPMNGNGAHFSLNGDDNTVENLKKKVQLLKFAEETHANWTKALVITHWSRVSEDVGKLVDLKVHIDQQKDYYDWGVHNLSEVKRGLIHARIPNPDLRTAVEVLSTGKASWMPELGYIEPPPLTPTELLKGLQNLNTLLSIRLNLQEYDKLPYHFQNFSIKSGRVTFRVEDEFEVDLTIADEQPESQFWFIDFRFLFTPTITDLPDQLRYMIEGRVNVALEKDGLAGCYKYLHELTLTHKIGEFRRQAVELSRGRWIETLRVEPLHRALSIQYWVDRYGRDGPKSWIILGVHSGRKNGKAPDEKTTSKISLRWFRDGKEVKEHEIPLKLDEISAEDLIKYVITQHILHILSSTHSKLREKPLFKSRELALRLGSAPEDAKELELSAQLSTSHQITITIEPMTGRFAFSPGSRIVTHFEAQLNLKAQDPSLKAHEFIENLRCALVTDEVINRAISVGWTRTTNPGIKADELKPIFPRDTAQLSWFRRAGWDQDWIVAFSSSMSGERWWLIQTRVSGTPPVLKLNAHFQIPVRSSMPKSSYEVLSTLQVFSAALISHYTNLRALTSRRAQFEALKSCRKSLASAVLIPAIYVKLSNILNSRHSSKRSASSWSKDLLKLSFHGIEKIPSQPQTLTSLSRSESDLNQESQNEVHPTLSVPVENVVTIAEAKMSTPMPASLNIGAQKVDKDIAFHPTSGAVAVRVHTKVGESAIPMINERFSRVERLTDYIAIAKKHEKHLQFQKISLGQLVFSYGSSTAPSQPQDASLMEVDLESSTYSTTIDFGSDTKRISIKLKAGNPHIRVLDSLTSILNSDLGLNGVARWIPLTLPILRGLDAIELAWDGLEDHGSVIIHTRAIDSYSISYEFATPADAQDENVKPRKLSIAVTLKTRGVEPWWWIRRAQGYGVTSNDDIDVVLRKVWDTNPDGEDDYRGMQNASIARGAGGEALLKLLDDSIREMASSSAFITPVAPDPEPQAQPQQQPRPQAQMQSQPPQQQPRPQAQMQSQPQPRQPAPILPPTKQHPVKQQLSTPAGSQKKGPSPKSTQGQIPKPTIAQARQMQQQRAQQLQQIQLQQQQRQQAGRGMQNNEPIEID